jgi:hypothetical protein
MICSGNTTRRISSADICLLEPQISCPAPGEQCASPPSPRWLFIENNGHNNGRRVQWDKENHQRRQLCQTLSLKLTVRAFNAVSKICILAIDTRVPHRLQYTKTTTINSQCIVKAALKPLVVASRTVSARSGRLRDRKRDPGGL